MGITKEESNARRCQALRRRQEFAALTADLREGRRMADSMKRARPPVRTIECAVAAVRGFPSGPQRSRARLPRALLVNPQPGERSPLSIEGFVAELNRRSASLSLPAALRFVVIDNKRATWQGDRAMRPLVARLVAEVQQLFGTEFPFYADSPPGA